MLRRGGVLAYPTDTVYGLGAHAFMDEAVARVFRIKGRPQGQALPLLLARPEDLEMVARDIPPWAWELARRFWPGALTLVLKKAPFLCSLALGRGDTVAARIPAHPIPLAIIRALGAPITGTSANRSGGPSPATAEEVRRELGAEVDLILEGGPAPRGVESTILDLAGERPWVLRQGAVPLEEIEKVCPLLVEPRAG